MFHNLQSEQQLINQVNKAKELSIRNESLDKQVQDLLEEIQVTPEQLTVFVENEQNFTEKNWEELQKHRSELDEKLQRELANIRDPLKAKQKQAQLKVGPHWLFVR